MLFLLFCFVLYCFFCCRGLQNMLETLNQSQATTNSVIAYQMTDASLLWQQKLCGPPGRIESTTYLQATVMKYSLIYHLLLWNAHENKYLYGSTAWDGMGWFAVKLSLWAQWRNKPHLLLSMSCCYSFENLYSASFSVVNPIISGFQLLL